MASAQRCVQARRLARAGLSQRTFGNHVLNAWLLSALLFTVVALWFGPIVLPWLLGQAVIGFCLLEIVNYIEHYGLRRQRLPSGRYEKVAPRHSWNSNTVVANVFLFHLQRHSDHHANPGGATKLYVVSTTLPNCRGYGTMLVLALVPPLWRRVMDRLSLIITGRDRPSRS